MSTRFVGVGRWALGAGGSLVGARRLALGAGIALTLGAALLAAQQRPVFRGGANFVLVDAYPSKDGRIVEGLSAADFQILEDGKPQVVDSIEFVRVEPTPEAARQDPNTVADSMAQAADPHNRVFVVFLDSYHTTVGGSYSIRAPLVDALNRIIAPTDLYALTTQYHRAKDLVFARKLDSLEEQLTRYWPWGERNRVTRGINLQTDPMEDKLENCFHIKHKPVGETQWVPENWLVNDGPARRYLDDIVIERFREDKTLSRLDELIVYLGQLREARSTVLLVSDGWLLPGQRPELAREPDSDFRTRHEIVAVGKPLGNSQLGSAVESEFAECTAELNRLVHIDESQRFRDLFTRAQRNNVTFYPIAASGLQVFDRADASANIIARSDAPAGETILGRDAMHLSNRVTSLRELAENTDGIAVVNTNDLRGGLRRIADDVSAYYLLGYYSTNTKFDGKFRKIDVKVTRPGLSVHARRGYLAPGATPGAAPAPGGSPDAANRPAAGASAAAGGVSAAIESLSRVKETADVSLYGVESADEIAVVVELSIGQLGRGAWPKGARVQVDVTGAGGVRVGTAAGTIDAGARSVIVRLPSGGGDGPWNALARVTGGTADDLDGRAEVRRTPAALVGEPLVFRATPAPASPLRPVADFRYRRTERVHVEWPVLAALDRREARLLDRNGQPLPVPVNVTERDVNGRPSVAADVNLAPLTAGDYVIELTIGGGGKTEQKLIAIRGGVVSEGRTGARRWALGAGLMLGAAVLAAQQRPVFRGGTNFVQVDVYPRRDGQVVAGLNAEDFEILEDGKPQKVELFEFIPFALHTPDAARRDPNTVRESEQLAADPRYRVFVIYLDRYNTQLSASHEARRPVVQFLDRAIGPSDLFAVMTPDLPPTALAFGQRSETVEHELTKYWTWGTKESEMQAERGMPNLTAPGEKRLWDCYITRYPVYEKDLAIVKQLLEVWRKDALFTSLESLMIRMRGLREPRTNLLLLTEGWVVGRADDQLRQYAWNEMPQIGVTPGGTLRLGQTADGHTDHAECDTELFRLAQIDFDRRFRDLLTLARRSNVSVYPVDLAGLRAPVGVTATTNSMSVVSTLRTLAENTDGIAVVDTNSLERGLKEIADSLSSYYLLGYYSTNTSFDGKFRSIDVKVKRPSVSISARRGYFAPTDAMLKTGAARPAAVTSTPSEAIAAALGRLKAPSSTDLLTAGSASATEISVIAELSTRLAMASPWSAGADVTVTLTAGADRIGVATGRIEPGARSVLVRVPTGASNGPWRAVVQASSGRENVSDRLDIQPAASAHLGDPAMYRATPAPASPLRPTADPSYRRTERAHIEWPVGAAGDTREARLLDRAGQKLEVPVTLTTREAGGRTVIVADVNLAPLSAGDYVIELIVSAGSSSERALVAFRVIQ